MLPRTLLDAYTSIQLLSSVAGTDFSSLSQYPLYTSVSIYPDGNESGAVTLTTTPIAISSINYSNFISFRNRNTYSVELLMVKLTK